MPLRKWIIRGTVWSVFLTLQLPSALAAAQTPEVINATHSIDGCVSPVLLSLHIFESLEPYGKTDTPAADPPAALQTVKEIKAAKKLGD